MATPKKVLGTKEKEKKQISKKTEVKKEPTGLQQAEEIYKIFNEKMSDGERQAFLLGRISIMLEVGNNFADTCNQIIKDSDDMLKKLQDILKTNK
jgi:hypothetical protein